MPRQIQSYDNFKVKNGELKLKGLLKKGIICTNITIDDIRELVSYLDKHPNITALDISSNNIGDEGAKLLSTIATIKQLNAANCSIKDEGLAALFNMTTIVSLNISSRIWRNDKNEIGLKSILALEENKTLQCLDLSGHEYDVDLGVIMSLAEHKTMKVLNISRLYLGDDVAIKIANSCSIKNLNISDNDIGNAGIRALVNNNLIRHLDVSGNKFDDEGAQLLAECQNLKSLNISFNWITSKAIIALAKSRTIQELDVSLCLTAGDDDSKGAHIDDEAAIALSKNKKIIDLNLDLSDENEEISDENKKLIANTIKNNQVRKQKQNDAMLAIITLMQGKKLIKDVLYNIFYQMVDDLKDCRSDKFILHTFNLLWENMQTRSAVRPEGKMVWYSVCNDMRIFKTHKNKRTADEMGTTDIINAEKRQRLF